MYEAFRGCEIARAADFVDKHLRVGIWLLGAMSVLGSDGLLLSFRSLLRGRS
jgi:hypothetical protein